jgi:hypothetical protein
MTRSLIPVLVCFLLCWSGPAVAAPREAGWQYLSNGIYEPEITSIAVHPHDPAVIFAGTSRALYRSTDHGRDFQAVFQPGGSRRAVNDIYIYPGAPQQVYAATDSGVYYSQDMGASFQQIFRDTDSQGRCLSFSRDERRLYVGTEKGVFVKEGHGSAWRPLDGNLQNQPISFLVHHKETLYIAADNELYRLDPSAGAPLKIFSLPAQPGEDNAQDEFSDPPSRPATEIRSIAIAEGSTRPVLYVSTRRGIFYSINEGEAWESLPAGNVPWEKHTAMVIFEHTNCPDVSVYSKPCRFPVVATREGVFAYDGSEWIVLHNGMATTHVNFLVLDLLGRLYAATDRGLFFVMLEQALSAAGDQLRNTPSGRIRQDYPDYGEIQKHFAGEPSIQTVHQLAIEYAEVHPEKIRSWRRGARNRALLPRVSFGLDRAATDLFHWDTGQNPDVLQKGRDYLEWDATLSWDLGDFVWSTSQTTIDSRSKLMVELREDILDQVTRLYFERRRLQLELMDPALDAQSRLDRDIRVAELTALVDGLTGGEFSRLIEQKKDDL